MQDGMTMGAKYAKGVISKLPKEVTTMMQGFSRMHDKCKGG